MIRITFGLRAKDAEAKTRRDKNRQGMNFIQGFLEQEIKKNNMKELYQGNLTDRLE
jgi:hypothetical protein